MRNKKGKAGDYDKHVGRQIRHYRRALNMSQEKLADAINVTFQQVQKYENGKNRISAGKLYMVAEYLGIGVEDFFQGLPALEISKEAKDSNDLYYMFSCLKPDVQQSLFDHIDTIRR